MAAAATSAEMSILTPGFVDLPDDVFALIAPLLSLGEVCRLRATCHRLLRCSALLAGACQPATRPFYRSGECVPEAVLAWAIGHRYMAGVYLVRGGEMRHEGRKIKAREEEEKKKKERS